VALDELEGGIRQEIAGAAAGGDETADVGGGDVEHGHLEYEDPAR